MNSRLRGLKPIADVEPTAEQRIALKSMVKSLSPSSSVNMMSQMLTPAGRRHSNKDNSFTLKVPKFANKKNSASFHNTSSKLQIASKAENRSTSTIPAQMKQKKMEEAKIRESFEKKGYSM